MAVVEPHRAVTEGCPLGERELNLIVRKGDIGEMKKVMGLRGAAMKKLFENFAFCFGYECENLILNTRKVLKGMKR